jgi:WD40 repeat protein
MDNPAQALAMLNDAAACPPELHDAAWHGYERLCRFDRSALTKSHGEVTALAAMPDAQWLASGGTDGVVRVWDVPSGHERRALRGHTGAVSALAWRVDGKALLSGGRDGQLKHWDLQRGSEIKDHFHSSNLLPSREAGRTIRALALAPDGRTAAVARQADPQSSTAEGPRVELWDAQTGNLRTVLRDVAGPLAFSPDGRTLAVGGQLWDADTGTPRSALRQSSGEVRAVAFTADGTGLALGIDAGLDKGTRKLDAQIWDLSALRSPPR